MKFIMYFINSWIMLPIRNENSLGSEKADGHAVDAERLNEEWPEN